MTEEIYQKIVASAQRLEAWTKAPQVGVVLGSGLGALANELERSERIQYRDIPGFPDVHVIGHSGELVVGYLPNSQIQIVALSGRVHVYEGHAPHTVVHPLRTLAHWGVKGLILTNAAGGINPEFKVGDLMLIEDHINLTGKNPLEGPNDDRLGTRFPDMTDAYDKEFRERMTHWSKQNQTGLKSGVYCGLLGPSYETPAEIRMLNRLGGDAVGMSTVVEVIAARHLGLRVGGFSCITNQAAGLSESPLDHGEVKASADEAKSRFIALVNRALQEMHTLVSASNNDS